MQDITHTPMQDITHTPMQDINNPPASAFDIIHSEAPILNSCFAIPLEIQFNTRAFNLVVGKNYKMPPKMLYRNCCWLHGWLAYWHILNVVLPDSVADNIIKLVQLMDSRNANCTWVSQDGILGQINMDSATIDITLIEVIPDAVYCANITPMNNPHNLMYIRVFNSHYTAYIQYGSPIETLVRNRVAQSNGVYKIIESQAFMVSQADALYASSLA
jgi:hypothetical protein